MLQDTALLIVEIFLGLGAVASFLFGDVALGLVTIVLVIALPAMRMDTKRRKKINPPPIEEEMRVQAQGDAWAGLLIIVTIWWIIVVVRQ